MSFVNLSQCLCPHLASYFNSDESFHYLCLYQSVVSLLQYLFFTQSYLSFVVNWICQFVHKPTVHHWIVVNKILYSMQDSNFHNYSWASLLIYYSCFLRCRLGRVLRWWPFHKWLPYFSWIKSHLLKLSKAIDSL